MIPRRISSPPVASPSVEIMRSLHAHLRHHRPATALARVQAELARRPPARPCAGLVFYGNE